MTIGGKNAAILYVGREQINAQVPVDVPAGQQAVVVKSVVGTSTSFNVTVAATAPAIFFSTAGAAVSQERRFQRGAQRRIRQGRRRHSGLLHWPGSYLRNAGHRHRSSGNAYRQRQVCPVTATIGGKPATVTYAIASPGFAGLYQVALTVPAGVTGNSGDRADAGNGQLQRGLDFRSVKQFRRGGALEWEPHL